MSQAPADRIRTLLLRADNVLKNAPHTAGALMADVWKHAYTRQEAAFPAEWLRDHKFWPAVGRTLTFTGVARVCEVVLGMCIALLLWRPFRGEKWVRVAILLPLVATPVAVGMMWRLIFDPNIGFVNQLRGTD